MAEDGTLYPLHGALTRSLKRIVVVAGGHKLRVFEFGDDHATLEIAVYDVWTCEE